MLGGRTYRVDSFAGTVLLADERAGCRGTRQETTQGDRAVALASTSVLRGTGRPSPAAATRTTDRHPRCRLPPPAGRRPASPAPILIRLRTSSQGIPTGPSTSKSSSRRSSSAHCAAVSGIASGVAAKLSQSASRRLKRSCAVIDAMSNPRRFIGSLAGSMTCSRSSALIPRTWPQAHAAVRRAQVGRLVQVASMIAGGVV